MHTQIHIYDIQLVPFQPDISHLFISPHHPLPTRLLNPRDISSKRVHPEVILRHIVSAPYHKTPSPSPGTGKPYPRHLEISQDTTSLSSLNTPVPDLRRAGVTVHLGQLELCLRAHASGKGYIADDVSERLPIAVMSALSSISSQGRRSLRKGS